MLPRPFALLALVALSSVPLACGSSNEGGGASDTQASTDDGSGDGITEDDLTQKSTRRLHATPQPNGASCMSAADCQQGYCARNEGGMCSEKGDCRKLGCADEASICAQLLGQPGVFRCMPGCDDDSTCRVDDGYACGETKHWYGATVKVCLPPQVQYVSWDDSTSEQDCADAWGTDGSELSHCDATRDNYLVVRKSARNIALCSHGKLVKSYFARLGFGPVMDKQYMGDGRTPEGVTYIASIPKTSTFYHAMNIAYPSPDDAEKAFAQKKISSAERSAILAADKACSMPPGSTYLGGAVQVHGDTSPGYPGDWTDGCVGLENTDIDEIRQSIKARDTIVILH